MAHLRGIIGAYDFRFPFAALITFGRWQLSDVFSGHVTACGERVNIRTSWTGGESEIELVNGTGGWHLRKTAANCVETQHLAAGADHRIQISQRVRNISALLPEGSTIRLCTTSEVDAFADNLERAFRLIERYAVPYLDWCVPSIKCIVPIVSKKATSSGSHPKLMGIVVMSNDDRRPAIAEMLIHEASHQQLFVCEKLGGTTNGTDVQRYFSPLLGRTRPLERAFLAYHALVNMARFFALCVENGCEEKYIAGRLSVVRSQIAEMRPGLLRTMGLSTNGQCVLEALEEYSPAV